MEFATEMIIKSSLYNAKIAEVPITLHKDGRKAHAPHLKTFRDGWRTLRFFLMYSPRWLFLVPGACLIVLGVLGSLTVFTRTHLFGTTPDAHFLLFASMFIICGYQSVIFAILTKTFAISERMMPEDPRMVRFFSLVNLERGLIAAMVALLIGVALLLVAINDWRVTGWGPMDYSRTMRIVIPGVTLVCVGFQTILSGFFVSILGMKRK